MRYVLFILLFLLSVKSHEQVVHADKNFPFQVLYAENTKSKSGQEVKSLDMISIDDVLSIGENGTLAFIHYTGYPIEVSGDTILIVKDLQYLIGGSVNETKKKNKNLAFEKPNIEYLFISDYNSAVKNRFSATGACHDCEVDIEITYPPKLKNVPIIMANFEGDFCIKWQSTNAKNYEVEIRSIFNDLIKRYTTNTNELIIDGKEITNLRVGREDMLIKITDNENVKSSTNRLKEFQFLNLKFPYSCELNNASFALITGLCLERNLYNSSVEAEKYFVLATTLSDKAFYKEMLDNFRKRNQR